MSHDKHFVDMTPTEHIAWRAAWKAGKAERWFGSVQHVDGTPEGKLVECHAPTESLCVQLVQKALAAHKPSFVVSSPKKIEPDPFLVMTAKQVIEVSDSPKFLPAVEVAESYEKVKSANAIMSANEKKGDPK